MDPKTKREIVKAFYGFLWFVVRIAGKEGIILVDEAFKLWRSTHKPKSMASRNRARRKKS